MLAVKSSERTTNQVKCPRTTLLYSASSSTSLPVIHFDERPSCAVQRSFGSGARRCTRRARAVARDPTRECNLQSHDGKRQRGKKDEGRKRTRGIVATKSHVSREVQVAVHDACARLGVARDAVLRLEVFHRATEEGGLERRELRSACRFKRVAFEDAW